MCAQDRKDYTWPSSEDVQPDSGEMAWPNLRAPPRTPSRTSREDVGIWTWAYESMHAHQWPGEYPLQIKTGHGLPPFSAQFQSGGRGLFMRKQRTSGASSSPPVTRLLNICWLLEKGRSPSNATGTNGAKEEAMSWPLKHFENVPKKWNLTSQWNEKRKVWKWGNRFPRSWQWATKDSTRIWQHKSEKEVPRRKAIVPEVTVLERSLVDRLQSIMLPEKGEKKTLFNGVFKQWSVFVPSGSLWYIVT